MTDVTPAARPGPAPIDTRAGRVLIGALFLILMTGSGLAFYNLMVFLHAFSSEGILGLDWVSWAIGFFFVLNGFAGLGVSTLLDRFPARFVIAGGSLVTGASLALLGRVTGTVEFFVVFGVFGVGFAATSLIPAMTLVARWFHERRSVAVSIVSTGLSLGGILLTPPSARFIEAYGIAAVMPWIGLAYVAGILPLALFFVRDHPPIDDSSGTTLPEATGTPYREAVTSRYFIWLGAAYVAIMLAQVGVLQHLYNAVAFRVDTDFGRRIIQVLAGSSVVGRFSGGFVLLRAPIRPITFVLIAGQGTALACLAVAEQEWAIVASVVLFGLTVGNLLMIQPLLLANAFGMRDYGHIYSTSQLVSTVGYASGPGVIAYCFGLFGGYREAFWVAAGASALAFLCLALAGRPRAGP